jgi:Tol biopolymer transport system component
MKPSKQSRTFPHLTCNPAPSVRAPTIARAALFLVLSSCATAGGTGASGSEEQPTPAEQQAMTAVGGKASGIIVWSSSRLGNHDLFVMNTDGSHVHAITKNHAVDWFPRFSPDGSQILFTRSKKGWVYERDANADGKWDIYTITPDGKDETKVVDNASWGGWISMDDIVYVRSTAVFRRALKGGAETLLVDSTKVPALEGALLQQPELSKDGAYLAITLRGSKRETGVWDLAKKTWTRTGEGCQVNWSPSGSEIYWVHPTGNGGSRVLHLPMAGGKPTRADDDLDAITLIDLPGRRSHEYFPELSADGKWLVWGATQRGHDHDIADYEIHLWEVGTDPAAAARLTFHSGNDRWPDIFIPTAARPSTAPAPAAEHKTLEQSAPAAESEPTNRDSKPDSKPAKHGKKLH